MAKQLGGLLGPPPLREEVALAASREPDFMGAVRRVPLQRVPDRLRDGQEREPLCPPARGDSWHRDYTAPQTSAVVGSMTAFTAEIRFAGNPPWRACSRIRLSSGA